MRQKIGIIIMTIVLLGSSFYCVKANEKKQIVVILINELSFTDASIYRSFVGFDQLEEKAARGAMNINSGGTRNLGNSYLSIGSGTRANGLKELGKTYTQYREGSINRIVYAEINQLLHVQQKFNVNITSLADTLNQQGFSAWVFGNSDTDARKSYAPLITMNQNGISYGDIGKHTLLIDRARPFKIKTNYNYLLQQLRKSKDEGIELALFELGDIYRLEKFSDQIEKEHEIELRSDIYQEMGNFIASVLKNIGENDTLIVASPMVNNQAKIHDYLLAPIWIYQNGTNGNLLTSNTTKRDGIIANIDLAPTILQALDVDTKPKDMIGENITLIKSKLDLDKELAHIAKIHKYRTSVLYPYVMWQVIVLLFSLAAMLIEGRIIKKAAKLSLVSLIFLPLLLLTSSFWISDNIILYLSLLLIVSFGLAWMINFLKPEKIFLIIGLITFFAISIDILASSYLMKRSLLGYDPIIGARYYGIGNEYMGIYIGAGILYTAASLQVKKNIKTLFLTIATLIIMTLFLIFPTLGTNAGGAISAIFAAGYLILKILGYKWDKKGIILSVAFTILGFSILILVNLVVSKSSQSHIGRALNQLFNGDISSILLIINRKISMNIKLLKVSSWSKVIVTSIIAIGIFYLKNNFVQLKDRYLYLFYGFYGILVGASVSFFVNDSGVVSAATMIVYVAIPIIYLAINKQQEELED